jgi:hypothetical protein
LIRDSDERIVMGGWMHGGGWMWTSVMMVFWLAALGVIAYAVVRLVRRPDGRRR